jgi:hypothetical protein
LLPKLISTQTQFDGKSSAVVVGMCGGSSKVTKRAVCDYIGAHICADEPHTNTHTQRSLDDGETSPPTDRCLPSCFIFEDLSCVFYFCVKFLPLSVRFLSRFLFPPIALLALVYPFLDPF